MKSSVFVLVIVAFTLAVVNCESDPSENQNGKPFAKTTVMKRNSRSKLNREAEKGWKKNTLSTKSRPSGRLDSWSPPATARSTLARRPRREIELMRGGGHHGGGWVGHHHHGHGGWHGHRHVGIRGGILGGIFGRPLYRCRFVNRWGRCLDRHPIYGR